MTKKSIDTVEDVRAAMDLSSKFASFVWDETYDELMFEQQMFAEVVGAEGLTYHDHYSSFYFTISDRDAFIESMAYSVWDCFSELALLLHEKSKTLSEMDYSNKNYDLLDEWLDEKAKELLSEYEKELHSYENPDSATEDSIIETLLEEEVFTNYFIDGENVVLYHPAVSEYYETL